MLYTRLYARIICSVSQKSTPIPTFFGLRKGCFGSGRDGAGGSSLSSPGAIRVWECPPPLNSCPLIVPFFNAASSLAIFCCFQVAGCNGGGR